MKKWKKWTIIGLLSAFTYLGIGYQLAVFSWDTFHSSDGVEWLTGKTNVGDINGRIIADALWPMTLRFRKPAIVNGRIRIDSPGPLIADFTSYDRQKYLHWTMVLCGPRLLWGLCLTTFIHLATWFGLIVYFFVQFGWIIIKSLANIVLAPFGVNL